MNKEMSKEEIDPSVGIFLNPKSINPTKYLTQKTYYPTTP